MRRWTMTGSAIALAVLTMAAGAAPPAFAQQAKAAETARYQFKLGVLPFVDNTGSGGEQVGATVGRAVQAELSHSTSLIGRVLKLEEGVNSEDVDGEKAVEIARKANMDVVLVGMILEATADEASKGVQTPSIFGQSAGASARSVKAAVTLQGDLYNVVDGRKIDSIRVTGRASDTKVGADVSTDFGSIGSDANALQNSPIGKALTSAVGELVKKIAADQSKMARNQPPADAAPQK